MPEQSAGPTSFLDLCVLACRWSVVRRGLKFAIVVGAILVAINHGDAILAGELARSNYLKMALTVLVPFVVSVLSSVGAMVEGATTTLCTASRRSEPPRSPQPGG